ncbi:MAG: AAA-like domain-containing protein [Fimbriimonas sp.]
MRTRTAIDFFVSGGTLPPGSASYVERGSDGALFEALRQGRYCYVLNSRQMGKSSLSVRTMAQLESLGIRTVFLDLTQIGGRNVTPDQWYTGICGEVGRALGLRSEFLAHCKANAAVSPMQRFFGGLREVVLAQIEEPIVIFVDEIDATKNLSFNTDEFFAGIRECFNRRVHDPVFKRLTFCLLGVAVPSDLISNAATTPFNIGERIQLQDFTLAELQKFATALGPNGSKLLDRVHHWTNGQPFLTQSLCQAIAMDEKVQAAAAVDALVFEQFFGPKARDTNINLADVSNRVLNGGAGEADPDAFKADLLSAYERIWKGGTVKDDESNRVAVVLKLSGLVRSDGTRLKVRNRIYAHVFDHAWVRESMPGQELRRQEQSFKRGIFRATVAAAALVGTVSALALYAWNSQQQAVTAKKELDYELYVADMNTMRLFEESGDIARMEEVLARGRNSPHRGFEWGFWMGRLHDSPEEYTLDYSAPGKRETGILSADGKLICIQDALLNTATVVDRATRKVIITKKMPGFDQRIIATSAGFLTFSPAPGRFIVEDLVTGKELHRAMLPSGDGMFSSRVDSDYAVSQEPVAGGRVRTRIWSLVTGKPVFQPVFYMGAKSGFVNASADGGKVLAKVGLGKDRSAAVVFDMRTGKEVDRMELASDMERVDFSPTGTLALLRNSERVLTCRDTVQKKIVFVRKWAEGKIPTMSQISPDEKSVIHLFADGQMEVTDLGGDQELSRRSNVWAVNATPETLIAASSTVRLLGARESAGARVIGRGYKVTRGERGVMRVFSDRPAAIVKLKDPTLEPLGSSPIPQDPRGMTYNGKWVGVSDKEGPGGSIAALDGDRPPLHFKAVPANFAASLNPQIIAILVPASNSIVGVSAKDGKQVWRQDLASGVTGMWINPPGTHLFITTEDTVLLIYDALTGKPLRRVDAHNVRLTNVTFPDDKHFFTCGADGRAILWNCKELTKVREFRGNAVQRISGADLSPDGKRVATCSFAGAWQLWDVATGSQLMDITASSLALRAVAFTSDGKRILTAGEDNLLRVWSTLDKDPSIRVPIHQDFLKAIKK